MSASLHRQKTEFPIGIGDAANIELRMLNWSQQFSILLYLDSNSYPSAHSSYECILAAGTRHSLSSASGADLSSLLSLHTIHKDWLFGHINYDYKNVLFPKLHSGHIATSGFPLLHFFVPEIVCHINTAQTVLIIESFSDPVMVYEEIMATEISVEEELPKLTFTSLFDKGDYIATVEQLREHIREGDCYEINFCNKGYCADVEVQPLDVFKALNELSPAPFAAYYRMDGQYMMCTSPERYLKKEGDRVLSQPIKGTARRSTDPTSDNEIREALRNDIKERAENVMIVDLVRNDLARSCEVGSIAVDELFGIYSYPQVHQMISTVSGQLKPGIELTEAIKHSFPMGSMSGAPKYKVMQLIEQYERAQRELFAGSVGYITPDGDFDFNVIIRSLFYNADTQYLSYQTGGAITYDSVPQQEWEEMRLKAWALERIFS